MPTRPKTRADKCTIMAIVQSLGVLPAQYAGCLASFWLVAVLAASCAAQGPSPVVASNPESPPRRSTFPPPEPPAAELATREGNGVGRHLLVRLPVPRELADGTVFVEPDVQLVDPPPGFGSPAAAMPSGLGWIGEGHGGGDDLGEIDAWPYGLQPIPGHLSEGSPSTGHFSECLHGNGCGCGCRSAAAEPLFREALSDLRCSVCDPCGPLATVFSPANRSGDIGIGRDRLALAPFVLDASQPNDNTLFRVDLAYGFPYPDRSEYLWAKPADADPNTPPGKGPNSELGVNYQDFRFRTEIGGEKFSVSTEIPIRSLDPITNENTTGMGDMDVATKTVLVDGKKWQLTQIFRTYIMTGAFKKGLGTGHVSLEPGVLTTYRWRPTTLIHSELKYWFPLGGDPIHSGQVLRYGLGYSHLVHETDAFAVIHTGEFVGLWFLDGAKTIGTQAIDIDNEAAYQFYPGFRFVADSGSDFGLIEFGFAGSFSMGQNSLFDTFFRFDVRLSY